MLPSMMSHVLRNVIYKKLAGTDIDWAVFGSSALAVRDIDVVPNDLDIVAPTRENAWAIDDRLAGFRVRKPDFSEDELVKSYWGKYEILGVDVDISGEIEYRAKGGGWTPLTYNKSDILLSGLHIPVITLDVLEDYYRTIGKTELVELFSHN